MTVIAAILIILYMVLSFGFSAFEKILNWKTTLHYYEGHFKATFLEKFIPVSIVFVLILEISSLIFCISGLYSLIVNKEGHTALIGLILVSLTLMILLLGQRIAKDYQGAMNITVYFILTVLGVYFLS